MEITDVYNGKYATTSYKLTAEYMEVGYNKVLGTWVAETFNEVGEAIATLDSSVATAIYADTQKDAVQLAKESWQCNLRYFNFLNGGQELPIFVYNKDGKIKERLETSQFAAFSALFNR